MIIKLVPDAGIEIASRTAEELQAVFFMENTSYVLITSSALKELPKKFGEITQQFWVTDSDIQLASKGYFASKRKVGWGEIEIGGNTNKTAVIAGPCSIESREQIEQTAAFLVNLGIKTLRAGAFKPRTSPYSFQGLGESGLKMLTEVREKYGLSIITEVKDSSHVDLVIEYADLVQIGAKAMYDQSILKACGRCNKPVLLKRGFGSTLQEFVQAAEFILSNGNPNVILCERGIRTFETKTRFTFDLCGAAYLKQYTNLPLILDPSHAMGYAYGVADLAAASLAFGCDGLLIEVHPEPSKAKSDASQQLNHEQFDALHKRLKIIANAMEITLV